MNKCLKCHVTFNPSTSVSTRGTFSTFFDFFFSQVLKYSKLSETLNENDFLILDAFWSTQKKIYAAFCIRLSASETAYN